MHHTLVIFSPHPSPFVCVELWGTVQKASEQVAQLAAEQLQQQVLKPFDEANQEFIQEKRLRKERNPEPTIGIPSTHSMHSSYHVPFLVLSLRISVRVCHPVGWIRK